MTHAPLPDPVRLAVDCMGGDHGPAVTLPACRAFLDRHPQAELILVGQPDALASAAGWPRCRIVAASEVVTMDDAIEVALRRKRDSSMRVAIQQLKADREGGAPQAHACVSAGNTGALMATARFVLKTIPGIDRPAIAKLMPSVRAETCVLDLGANVDCTPEQMLQFGIMGATLMADAKGRANPRVGLLNIGSEDIKGNGAVKQAGELLRQSNLNFVGNVEGNDIYSGAVDVVVCDGFTGNVALKTSEGLAHMVTTFLREEFTRNWFTRVCALFALPVLARFRRRVDSRRYNGASLLGLRGIVVKSHGGTDSLGFRCALEQAREEALADVIQHITEQVAGQLKAAATEA